MIAFAVLITVLGTGLPAVYVIHRLLDRISVLERAVDNERRRDDVAVPINREELKAIVANRPRKLPPHPTAR